MGNDKNERPRSAAPGRGARGYDTVWVEFSPADILSLGPREELVDGDVMAGLVEQVEAGWKVSVSYSESHSGYVCSATCKQKGHQLEKMVLLLRHEDMFRGLQALLYAIAVMAARGDFSTASLKNVPTW